VTTFIFLLSADFSADFSGGFRMGRGARGPLLDVPTSPFTNKNRCLLRDKEGFLPLEKRP
jgi:hypothetical protein